MKTKTPTTTVRTARNAATTGRQKTKKPAKRTCRYCRGRGEIYSNNDFMSCPWC